MLKDVGRNLRKLRRDRDFTQTQLARFAGVRQQELSAIERGLQPPLVLVDRLARGLGVHPDELLRRESGSCEPLGHRETERESQPTRTAP